MFEFEFELMRAQIWRVHILHLSFHFVHALRIVRYFSFVLDFSFLDFVLGHSELKTSAKKRARSEKVFFQIIFGKTFFT